MSDIIYTPPASGGGTTINPTNNVIPVRSNATTFIDSLLFSNTSNLKSVYSGNDIGLKLDFGNKEYFLGDLSGYNNTTRLYIDDGNKFLILGSGLGDGSGFNYSYIGNGSTNYYSLVIGCAPDGVGLVNQETGDPNTSYGSFVSGGSITIQSQADQIVNINAFGTSPNSLVLDPASDKMSFTTGALNFIGIPLMSGSAGSNSGKYLIITINGGQYKIQLLNV